MTGRANAVAAPIAIRKNQTVEQRIVCIHATTLAHGHVVRRIEAAGADIAPSAGITGLSIDGIGCTQGIAVILYQPEVVLLTERLNTCQIKRISQCMSNHDRLRFFRQCRFQFGYIDIILRNRYVYKHRHSAILQNRGDCSRETTCNGDDLISSFDL